MNLSPGERGSSTLNDRKTSSDARPDADAGYFCDTFFLLDYCPASSTTQKKYI
jgi:hypothetical protein